MKVYKGPIVGIMTARNSRGAVKGNGPLFIELQKKLISLNGISFVFTIEGVKKESIEGYSYLPEKNRWIKDTFPIPDVIYNRIPFRKSEERLENQQFFLALKERNIPYFNPCFIDKFSLIQLCGYHNELKHFLPETILANDREAVQSFLEKHSSIYLKPSQSSKGKGIYRLCSDQSSSLELKGLRIHQTFPSFKDFWEKWNKRLINQKYLAQQEVISSEYQGKRFDFRILAHGREAEYTLTGVGIRQSQEQEITTHIPAGGTLLPYRIIQSEKHDEFIKKIVPMVGDILSKKLGYFGEFSIDAAVDQSGHYYIFEVNSKPMRFDEREIEEARIEKLCKLFLQLSKKQIDR